MAITISPTSPVAGEVVTLTSSAAGGNTTRWQIVTVPEESELVEGDFLLDSADGYVDEFTPDVAGEYAFKAYGYTTFTTVAQHANDTAAERTKFVGTESSTIHVGGYADIPIRTTNGNGCTLRLTVQNTTIVDAECILPRNDESLIGSQTTAVVAALAACVGTSTTSLTSVITGTNLLRAAYEAHRVRTSSSTHATADTVNVVNAMIAVNLEDAVILLNELARDIDGHMCAGATGTRWHATTDDTSHRVGVARSTDTGGAYLLCVDLMYRAYERHRVMVAGVHGAADNTNTLPAAGAVDTAVVELIDAMIAVSATAPSGKPAGLYALAQKQGFEI